jgi:beta-glucosidase
VRATVEVQNTGSVAGEEVVQLYVGYEGSRVDRPVRELKAFRRVVLAPGEIKNVSLEFPASELAFWDVTANEFVVEPIDYVVECGASSRDLPLQAKFSVRP